MDRANLKTLRLLHFRPLCTMAFFNRLSFVRGIIFAKTMMSGMFAETRLAMCIAVAH